MQGTGRGMAADHVLPEKLPATEENRAGLHIGECSEKEGYDG